ncbi:MAG: hypothetical protein E7638_06340 [Ruminococcaceae bacterium]|nr:hypothetical protein [Oscillospiraceae bacterium]
MKRILISAAVICAAIAVVLVLILQNNQVKYTYTAPDEAAFLMENTKFIIHAAGRLDEETGYPFDGSNSVEGLQNAYENGCRIIELDFNFTSDGELACIHDWYTQYSSAITDNVPLTLAEFLNCRIYDRYTPLWLGTLVEFMREHEDVYIVTDIKDDNLGGAAAIAEYCPDLLNRFIIQIYDKSEYAAVRDLGFEYIIFTLYRLDWQSKTDTAALGRFAKKHPLIGYTFAAELCEVEGYVEGMLKTGVPLFVHTVNDAAEQDMYFNMGISGIYTDMTSFPH